MRIAGALMAVPHGAGTQPLLLGGAHALWEDGDRLVSRDRFDAAYRRAEAENDTDAMARAALGLCGLWLHEHRSTAVAVLVQTRLRRALAGLDPVSSPALRLRARLAGEADYRTGGHAGILALVQEARLAADPVALAEAATMAHQCVPGPEHGELRRGLAEELIGASFRTARRSDLVVGLLWRIADLLLAADPHAERQLADLTAHLAREPHPAVGFVVHAIDVMREIRAGRLERAEALARSCAERGRAAGDTDTLGWHGLHTLAVRWYQGRVGELLPVVRELVNSPTLSVVDDSQLAALAVAAATVGDHRQAAGALARLRGRDLARLPRSNSWLVTMYGIVEAANLLGDAATAAEVHALLLPWRHLPMMAGPGIACFGSVEHALGVAALTTGDTARAVSHFRAAVQANLALGHWPAATLSRARLAQALGLRGTPGCAADAVRERDLAIREAAELGMVLPAYERAVAGAPAPVLCRRRAGRWVLELHERTAVVEDSLGMGYLAVLFANPGREIPAVQLAAGPGLLSAAAADSAASSSQPVLDDVAVRAYRQRLVRLQAEADAYRAGNDPARADRAQTELDWLAAELRAASGLGGRLRTFANSDELARISVGKAIRRALQRIAAAEPALGQELRAAVTTGLRCCYRPDPSAD